MLSLPCAETSPAPLARITRRAATMPASQALRASPCHRLRDGVLAGVEITHADGVAPGDAAAQAWLLRAACQEASAWAPPGLWAARLDVTVALPLRAIGGTLLAQVEAALDGARLSAARLVVALPQADLADAGPDVLLRLSALRDLGADVALDGAPGADGAERALRRLPVNALRLHPALVQQMEHDTDVRVALSRTVRLAHRVETRVVALGVCTALQRDILADLLCDTAQGRLYGQDLPGSAFRAWVG